MTASKPSTAMTKQPTTAEKALNDDELEQNWEAAAVDVSDDDEVVSLGSEDELEDEDVELATNKRSREDAADGDDDDDDAMDGDAADEQVKKKQKVQKKEKPTKGLQNMTAAEHFKLVNDYYVKHRGGQMTTLEMAEGLTENHFVAPKGLGKHTLQSLPLYMRHCVPTWKQVFRGKKIKYDKSPIFLIVCSSALRAVEVLKHLSSFRCKVAKLFARHMKAKEQEDQLTLHFHPIAVGTPARLKKLLEMDALSLQHTSHVILDMAKDKKNMTILDLKDTSKDTMELLQFYLLPRLRQEKLKLVLY
ncbi:hypothetical protein ATCC90586_003304 [Pythium insidiosum]|nr:hypothetical protein ATCC90586_003304 [Pythium insidiosum]